MATLKSALLLRSVAAAATAAAPCKTIGSCLEPSSLLSFTSRLSAAVTCSEYVCITVLPVQVLNYGQSVFEGMKAQRSAKGRIVLFRPEENAARLQAGTCVCSSIQWLESVHGVHARRHV